MKYLLVTLVYLILIFIATVVNNPISSESTNYFLHFVEFAILSFLIYFTAKQYTKKPYFYAIGITSLLAVLTEVIQIFISARTFNLLDSLAGIIGSFLILILKIKQRKKIFINI